MTNFFNDGYYKTSKGYALKNYANTAFVLLKNQEVDEERYEVKEYRCLETILDESRFEEVVTFETAYNLFKVYIEMVGTEINSYTNETKYFWKIDFVSENGKCYITSEKYPSLTHFTFDADVEKSTKTMFSPRLILNCLGDEDLSENVKIHIKKYKYDNPYIMIISFEEYDMYICSMVDRDET